MSPEHSKIGKVHQWAVNNKLLLWTMVAILAGIVVGLCLRLIDLNYDAVVWLNIWGELFLRMLKMIILPLIMCCLVSGISSIESGDVGRLGVAAVCYVFSTQLLSVGVGVLLAALIHPGQKLGSDTPRSNRSISYTDVATDFLRNLFPENVVQACMEHAFTERKSPAEMSSNISTVETRELIYREGTNTIGIVVFSILLGVGIHAGGQETRQLGEVFHGLNKAIFKIMDVILVYSPLGIFSLIAGALVQVDHLADALQSMAMFIITVTVGLFVHQMILLPLIYLVLTRKNPFRLLLQMLDAILAGMVPPSDAMALSYLLRDCDGKLQIDCRISKFVLPIFVTINRDGSALFIGVSTIFIAQTQGMALGVEQYFTIMLMITLLSAAVAAVPSASIILLVMVASTSDIPVGDRLGLLLTVEWLLDRLRTGTNLSSTSFGVSIIAHHCSKFLGDGALTENPSTEERNEEMIDLV